MTIWVASQTFQDHLPVIMASLTPQDQSQMLMAYLTLQDHHQVPMASLALQDHHQVLVAFLTLQDHLQVLRQMNLLESAALSTISHATIINITPGVEPQEVSVNSATDFGSISADMKIQVVLQCTKGVLVGNHRSLFHPLTEQIVFNAITLAFKCWISSCRCSKTLRCCAGRLECTYFSMHN
jgi:hypothetical protein